MPGQRGYAVTCDRAPNASTEGLAVRFRFLAVMTSWPANWGGRVEAFSTSITALLAIHDARCQRHSVNAATGDFAACGVSRLRIKHEPEQPTEQPWGRSLNGPSHMSADIGREAIAPVDV